MSSPGYRALREGVALLDLPGRGHIQATGEDRARLLHAMTTNHIQELKPGDTRYAFLLNSVGRILSDVTLLCGENAFSLDTEPEVAGKVLDHLNRYIIADDVTLEDLTGKSVCAGLEGPKAREIVEALGVDAPEPGHWVEWRGRMLFGASWTGAAGYRLIVPVHERKEMLGWLTGTGAQPATMEEAKAVRLENAHPRYGEDFDEGNIPHETRLMHAIHFNKGCYLGQEIVERVRSRGHVNRMLVQLRIDGSPALARGSALQIAGVAVGEITSAAWSPAEGKTMALAYVRTEHAAAGTAIDAGGARAEVTALVPR